MPSEDQIVRILARRQDAFRSAVASAIEELRATVGTTGGDGQSTPTGFDLGEFAAGRIDVDRFSAVAGHKTAILEPDVQAQLRAAHDTLAALAARRSGLFRVTVPPGGDLVGTVGAAFAEIGRAFGASRIVELSRNGRYRESDHAAWLDAYAFSRWTQAERALAPPLVVTVQGADLRPEGLSAFLDGAVQIVLVVEGDAPPAPLVHCISPGVLVLQVAGDGGLDRLVAWSGPALAAVLPEGAAAFVHDPEGGPALADRLRVASVPDAPPRAVGGLSPFQQAEQIRQLQALAERPAAPLSVSAPAGQPTATAAPVAPDPVDKLAAWLLSQADLTGLD